MTVIVKRITPENVGSSEDRLQARCESCQWTSIRVRYASSVEPVACEHVRHTGHTVSIEEDTPATTPAGA